MQEKKSPFGVISEENIFIGQDSIENKLLTRKEVEVIIQNVSLETNYPEIIDLTGEL